MQNQTSKYTGLLLQTARLQIEYITYTDAQFICDLLNDDGFLRYVGDKQVRNIEQACSYIEQGPQQSYQTFGFGLYKMVLTRTQQPIGICGLIKRPELKDVDIGYAILQPYESQGYVKEAAQACLQYGYQQLKLPRIIGITDPKNIRSINVLTQLGLTYSHTAPVYVDEPSAFFVPSSV
ncbi:MAG: GNAT family N-acetyltransferase [Plesiomonas sp.]|uniref:GNAT family N-acetyltransferase n=1 Tax=Plesiomonas sp. TaxID=2486279 RepID=UPI003F3100E1